ncbi:TPA: hypothetical protein QDB51_002710 [Burkholderia vietnamiensis]|nr:hypothetical protein [Burkholderia vietnamiensis]
MENLLITHSQANRGAISQFFIPCNEQSHLDLTEALCRYNGVEIEEVNDKSITLSNKDKIEITKDSWFNMRMIARFFDNRFGKETIINKIEEIKTFTYKGDTK